ncbi:hypothetical protein GH714_033967 [Hevea brasiliensis]|uniref:Uncharacterized protein n=1 Tax=Hevea brasiliensis TaxID=3981 RepID=A0A6A6K884_HEVBR|nr:hypothetical protein GH714_033967 [Hevea brasiliensis]
MSSLGEDFEEENDGNVEDINLGTGISWNGGSKMRFLIQKGETSGFDVKKENNLLVDATIFHGDGEEEEVDIIVGRARFRQDIDRVPIVSIPRDTLTLGIQQLINRHYQVFVEQIFEVKISGNHKDVFLPENV